jgi:hypothetical protein
MRQSQTNPGRAKIPVQVLKLSHISHAATFVPKRSFILETSEVVPFTGQSLMRLHKPDLDEMPRNAASGMNLMANKSQPVVADPDKLPLEQRRHHIDIRAAL